ncbi:MAG: ABC transporter ATP-binding protein [Oligoflexus sp.]
MSQVILSLENLDIKFHSKHKADFHAVKNLNLEIHQGETFALVGESGSGKSVTSLAIMGLLPSNGRVTAGKVQFAGQDLLQLAKTSWRKIRGHQIAMIFQEPMTSLNPLVPVGQQIMEPLRIHRQQNRQAAKAEALRLLDRVGLQAPEFFFKKYPHELSGGQQQRIMIAMAISCQPKLLIADEPTTALDVTIQKQVLELLQELQQEMNMALLFITHDLGVVADIADRIGVMRYGQLVECDLNRNIFAQPKHPYTQGLIACRPPLHTKPRRLATVQDFTAADGQAKRPDPQSFQGERRRAATSGEQSIIALQQVSKIYQRRSLIPGLSGPTQTAVDQVSLNIPEGCNFGLVGESGCGKTTIARLMMRLLKPSSGQIYFRSQDISQLDEQSMKPIRRRIQYIFQNPYAALNPRFRVEQILLEPMQIHQIGTSRAEQLDKIDDLLLKVGLDPAARRKYPHEFSGGQRQRICIARALTVDPELVICDESVAALDVSIQAQILNLLLDLQEQHPMTYIFISHDLSVVRFFCDRIAVMKDGAIVETQDAEALFNNPQHPFTQNLLGSIPRGIPKGLTHAVAEYY